MPSGWNANTGEKPAFEGHEQVRMNNPRTGPTQGLGTGPTSTPEAYPLVDPNRQTRPTLGIQKTTPQGEENLSLLEECFSKNTKGALTLAEAFLRQSTYNEDMAPDRSQLQPKSSHL
ncbi:hypothetical protein CR513_56609, partial [Mucuna pruriens]